MEKMARNIFPVFTTTDRAAFFFLPFADDFLRKKLTFATLTVRDGKLEKWSAVVESSRPGDALCDTTKYCDVTCFVVKIGASVP